MLLRKVAVENVRSFLERAELSLDGPTTIVIGPNGGGKTNLLDTIVIALRRYLFASMYAVHRPTPDNQDRYEFTHNDILNNMIFEKHSAALDRPQLIDIEIEVTPRDVENMVSMKRDADQLIELAKRRYANLLLHEALQWDLEVIEAGMRVRYRILDGNLQQPENQAANYFWQYLKMFEMDGKLREEFEFSALSNPLIYLPVNRSAAGFQSRVELAGYNESEIKRMSDGASSRTNTQIVNLAIGKLAQKYRLLLEKDTGGASVAFYADSNLKELTRLLKELGYDWELETVSALRNQYDVRLKKQGKSFVVSAASSGERELLTYLFAIFALNVRDALIIVDEPELHLHPKWQRTLLLLFIRLSESTGNQFLMATHSPMFVSPESIQYVSRVFSQEQQSQIKRLDTSILPEARHLLSIVNSQNNERLFFADRVVLVEGLSDRIFFEAVLDRFGRSTTAASITEVISVGGKGLFKAYMSILKACDIKCSVIADLDYVEQVGSAEIKGLFKTNNSEIKSDVIDNVKSMDGATLTASIELALENQNWDHAREIWAYIKSKRIKLIDELGDAGKKKLSAFLAEKRNEGLYILQLGALEAYLPEGYASKDLEKLIRFLGGQDFWDLLPDDPKSEIKEIALEILGGP
jgi:predicted ATP-dependent endonuclease of OLD family